MSCGFGQIRIADVRDEHITRRMRDHIIGRGLPESHLRGYAAGPEYRDLARSDLRRITKVRCVDVANAVRLGRRRAPVRRALGDSVRLQFSPVQPDLPGLGAC